MNDVLTAEMVAAVPLARLTYASTYHKGFQYYRTGRARVTQCDAHQATLAVRGTRPQPYEVTIEAIGNGEIRFDCTCPPFEGDIACKHVIAGLLALAEYLRHNPLITWETVLSQALQKATPTRKAAAPGRSVLLFSLQNRDTRWGIYLYSLPAKGLPEDSPLDPAVIARVVAEADLSREATSVRTFSLARFATLSPDAIRAARMVSLLQMSPYAYGGHYGSATSSGLENVLPLLGDTAFFLGEQHDPLKKRLTIVPEPATAALKLAEGKAGVVVQPILEVGEKSIPLKPKQARFIASDPPWVLIEDTIYCLEGAPAVFLALAEREPVTVPLEAQAGFVERYLLPLAEHVPLRGNLVTWQDAPAVPPTRRLYLSERNNELRAHLRFVYGLEEFAYDPALPKIGLRYASEHRQIVRVPRDPDAEQGAWEALSEFRLKREASGEPGWLSLRARTEPIDFLMEQTPRLSAAGYEVFGEEALTAARVNRNSPTISLRVSSGIDWFDVEAVIQFGDVEASLADLRRALRKRERYVKLADGAIGMLPEEWLEKYRHLFALGEEEGERLRFSSRQALLLDQLIADSDGSSVDEGFIRQRERLRHFTEIVPHPLPSGLTASLYPYQKAGFDWLHFLHEYDFGGCLADDMGLGKAQPLDAKILTPHGWVRMGDVRVGMEVIGADGRPTRVIGVYPQGEKEVFHLTFSDGAQTECCDEHLWAVNSPVRKRRGNPPLILPLSHIRARLRDAAGNCRWYVPIAAPVEFEEEGTPLPLAPYLLGALLGDGCIRHSACFRAVDAEMLARVEALLPDTCTLRHLGRCDYRIIRRGGPGNRPNPVIDALRSLGLMGKGSADKFVPDRYKFGSVETRLAVLQGLMDTDGWVTKEDSTVGFSSASETLARDTMFLVRSLGGVARLSIKKTTHLPAFNLILALPRGIVPFALARKAEVYRPRTKYPPTRAIVSVASAGVKPTQCIAVEAVDRLYVTDDFVITHNTLQALALLLSLRAAGGNDHTRLPDLVVMPRSLLFNWEREAARFTPDLRILIYADGRKPGDEKTFGDYDLVLTTYRIMLGEIETLRQCRFHYAILDEAQAIKNPLSQTARAARLLLAEHRLTLTGTPVENSPVELWSQFAFLNPGMLGGMESFRTDFATPIERQQDETTAQTLRHLIRPFLLRRVKEEVAPELPPRTEELLFVEMEPAQSRAYHRLRDQYRAQVLGLLDQNGISSAQMKILEGLMRLRQICDHPRLVDPEFRGESAKLVALMETLETLASEGHKALVFSQFVQMLTLVREALDAQSIPYAYLDGRTRNRQERVDQFQTDPAVPFFLISLKAGGVGLNLTAADYVLHVDPWWNPAVERQATDRAHRIGQDKPVFIYKFITKDSVEEKILQLQERKKLIVEQLITAETGMFKSLTRDDIAALFS